MELKSKSGVFFSLDALIALSIILITILIAYPQIKEVKLEKQIHQDVITSLSSIKIGEIDSVYVKSLISQGKIKDANKSVLEQIGEFYVTDISLAKSLAEDVLSSLDTTANIGIWYGSTLVYSKNSTPLETAKNIETARQIVTGIREGRSVTGFSSRAFLTNSLQSKYYYFGGYVGDGNITINADYSGTINSAELELTINKDFSLYINNNSLGLYSKSDSEFTPKKYSLPISNFQSGNNTIEFKGDKLHIAGGYLKITYESSPIYEQPTRYYFPGIKGAANLYDGFYLPSISSMNIFLHYNTNSELFLNIRNTTVFESGVAESTEKTSSISNSELQSLLSYAQISGKTIPLRLGLKETTINGTGNASVVDVILTTSRVSAMSTNDIPNATSNITRIDAAKYLDNVFVDEVLKNPASKVGLVSYKSDAPNTQGCTEWAEYLTQDKTTLKCQINSYNSRPGERCLCCALKRARQYLAEQYSNSSRKKFIVLMSDGSAEKTTPDPDKCGEMYTGDPKQDSINQACIAYEKENITVHTIGFGPTADNTLLKNISACGGGKWFASTNLTGLEDIYTSIAKDIIEVSYTAQTVQISVDGYAHLFPDSYIEFNYTKESTPLGLILNLEEKFTDNSYGTFSVSSDSNILEAKTTSYSGSRWTKDLEINNISVYNLTIYGNQYTKLGDPFFINLPKLQVGKDNIIKITTGNSPSDSSTGSSSNKIIYKIIKNATSYSGIVAQAQGCIWSIQFEDYSNITVRIPSSYSGNEQCYYILNDQQYNSNDAFQSAVFNLLDSMDLDQDGLIETKFTEQNLNISSSQVTGIPYTWSTEVQARIWY